MAFEWKLIGEILRRVQSKLPIPNSQLQSLDRLGAGRPYGAAAGSAGFFRAFPTDCCTGICGSGSAEGYQPTPEAIPGAPRCEVHNAAVNTTEKAGYNAAYDAEVYSSYDTGVNPKKFGGGLAFPRSGHRSGKTK
jgi:hypothetical protein